MNDYLEFAKSVAYEAGDIMYKNFLAGSKKEWKDDGTPLTITDTTINKLVIEKVRQRFPSHGVLGEEESYNLGNEFTWVCDPVDGTTPFSHSVPISTFSLALVSKQDGLPIVAVVYDPFIKRLFWAVKNSGSYLNGTKIKVNKKTDLKNAVIDIAGIPESTLATIKIEGSFLTNLFHAGAITTHMWSIILPSSLIAAGQYTATIFNVTKPEDGAAIKLIVEEAGGKVTDIFGQEQRYDQPINGFVASNGIVHQELVDLLIKSMVR